MLVDLKKMTGIAKTHLKLHTRMCFPVKKKGEIEIA
jgi:hypothetical protein